MMSKANFIRKAINEEELIRLSKVYQNGTDFMVEKIIKLSDEEYKTFSEGLLLDINFIADNKDLMHVDEYGVWHCILVIKGGGSKDGILVQSEGYDYARYSCYLKDIKIIVLATKHNMKV